MTPQEKALAAKTNRENPNWFLTNFLGNISNAARLMRTSMQFARTDPPLFQEAVRSYIISLVASLETFYRDLFVFLYATRPHEVAFIVAKLCGRKRSIDSHPDLTEVEIASATISFQRMDAVEAALSPFVSDPEGYFAAISKFPAICVIPSRSAYPAKIRLSPDWKVVIDALLAERHRYTHDRNCKCDARAEFMQRAETVVLFLGQLTAFYFLGTLVRTAAPEGALPALLLIEDLIACDWEAMPPDPNEK